MSRAAQRPTTLKFYCATQAASRLFKDDGVIPNHPKWPLFIYKSAVRLPGALDPAAVFEDLFRANGWGKSWRDSIYKYAHYHSRIHEVLGIARGSCTVQFGGTRGRAFNLKAGDVAPSERSVCAWSCRAISMIGQELQ